MRSGPQVVVSGGFDDLRSRDLRFLEEASKLGELTVLLWQDCTLRTLTGKVPKFTFAERLYMLDAVRYIDRIAPLRPRSIPMNSPPIAAPIFGRTTNLRRTPRGGNSAPVDK